jgi:hypothetical protein
VFASALLPLHTAFRFGSLHYVYNGASANPPEHPGRLPIEHTGAGAVIGLALRGVDATATPESGF